jgi:two-component system, OmpR family, copper resistance phosphate regulon response regulator CusR
MRNREKPPLPVCRESRSHATVHRMELMIVEDDSKVRGALAKGLSEAGYDVATASTAERAIERLRADRPRMVILDIGLPAQDGYAVLRDLRQRYGAVPVIILTARDSVIDRVAGLDAGADDYLVKPFAFPELLARIRARLRTRDTAAAMRIADLTVDPVTRQARRGTTPIDLTPLEFDLLRCLAENAGTIVTREMLASNVWHVISRATPIDNIIHVHVSHLRAKVNTQDVPSLIHTVRGLGYILEARP